MPLSMVICGTDCVLSSVGFPVHCWNAYSIEANKDGTIGARCLHLFTIFIEIHMTWNGIS